MDRDTPSESSEGNDIESVERLVAENSQDMCPIPIAIQTKTLSTVHMSISLHLYIRFNC